MTDRIPCPDCGAQEQEVGKFCEQCGSKVAEPSGDSASSDDATSDDPGSSAGAPAPDAPDQAPQVVTMRFIRLENGVFNRDHSFDVPVGATLMVGRTDPVNGIFPEVDVTMWSQRVQTGEGALYTIHRKQCEIARSADGRVWARDYPEYVGDTLLSPAGTSQFHTIPSLHGEREKNDSGAVVLEPGDRLLMGQGEGMLIFQLLEV